MSPARIDKAPSPGLRPTSPPWGEVVGGRGGASLHLSPRGRGRRAAAGEGAFLPLSTMSFPLETHP